MGLSLRFFLPRSFLFAKKRLSYLLKDFSRNPLQRNAPFHWNSVVHKTQMHFRPILCKLKASEKVHNFCICQETCHFNGEKILQRFYFDLCLLFRTSKSPDGAPQYTAMVVTFMFAITFAIVISLWEKIAGKVEQNWIFHVDVDVFARRRRMPIDEWLGFDLHLQRPAYLCCVCVCVAFKTVVVKSFREVRLTQYYLNYVAKPCIANLRIFDNISVWF